MTGEELVAKILALPVEQRKLRVTCEEVVANLKDWDLICFVNAPGYENDLPDNVSREVLLETWKKQDGYGEPGYMPPQGWDWSGIRDSSEEGCANMAKAIRRVLASYGIMELQVRKRW
jgi:hypothetical protein